MPRIPELKSFVRTIGELRRDGIDVTIVSSGAVGIAKSTAKEQVGSETGNAKTSLAAVGQGLLTSLWGELFAELEQPIAQVLLTRSDLCDQTHCDSLQRTLKNLLEMETIPILNENDTLSVGDAKFESNDYLASIVSGILQADYLFVLTDVDCLYDRNPRLFPDAKPIRVVDDINQLSADTSTSGSALGTGGMYTKITAARMAAFVGVATIITNFSQTSSIRHILQEAEIRKKVLSSDGGFLHKDASMVDASASALHTYFVPSSRIIDYRYLWLLHGLVPHGRIYINLATFLRVSRELPLRITDIERYNGTFGENQAAEIFVLTKTSVSHVGRALMNCSAAYLKKYHGRPKNRFVPRLAVCRGNLVLFPGATWNS